MTESSDRLDDLLATPELAEALEQESFKHFLDHLPIAIVISRQSGNEQHLVYANLAFEKLTGTPAGQAVGKDWSILAGYCLLDDPDHTLDQAIMSGEDYLGCFVPCGDDGQTTRLDVSTTVVQREGEAETFRLAALVDVSQRDHAVREEFEKTLRDRDLLLKELQHRVKNSLQIITALIRIEGRSVGDVEKARFSSMAARIEALGILYHALSDAPAPREIDLGSYLSQLASAVLRSHAEDGIQLNLQVENCPTTINVAMPVGLVVNEAITNALKHAFQDRDEGTITLHCLHHDGGYAVEISDDGTGLPEGQAWPQPGKISALIVQSLHENTRAEVAVESQPGGGTRITFVVPVDC
ncbi:MAG: sensor histidine kinase [Hyphomicrobiales bacterium]